MGEREVDVYESDEDKDEEDEIEERDEDEEVEEGNVGEEENGEEEYQDDRIIIMARNIQPTVVCDDCGKPAAWISTRTGYNALCDACRKKAYVVEPDEQEEEDGEEEYEEYEEDIYYGEGLLPVVNSPRMGVCGYTG